MYIRFAYWLGAPRPGTGQQFQDLIERELLPAMRAMPGVSAVRDGKLSHIEFETRS